MIQNYATNAMPVPYLQLVLGKGTRLPPPHGSLHERRGCLSLQLNHIPTRNGKRGGGSAVDTGRQHHTARLARTSCRSSTRVPSSCEYWLSTAAGSPEMPNDFPIICQAHAKHTPSPQPRANRTRTVRHSDAALHTCHGVTAGPLTFTTLRPACSDVLMEPTHVVRSSRRGASTCKLRIMASRTSGHSFVSRRTSSTAAPVRTVRGCSCDMSGMPSSRLSRESRPARDRAMYAAVAAANASSSVCSVYALTPTSSYVSPRSLRHQTRGTSNAREGGVVRAWWLAGGGGDGVNDG